MSVCLRLPIHGRWQHNCTGCLVQALRDGRVLLALPLYLVQAQPQPLLRAAGVASQLPAGSFQPW